MIFVNSKHDSSYIPHEEFLHTCNYNQFDFELKYFQ